MNKDLIFIEEPVFSDNSVNKERQKKPEKRQNHKNIRLAVSLFIYIVLIPLCIFLGIKLFNDKKYNIISAIIAILACVPFFISFESRKTKARELVVIAVMTAISVVGRIIFSPVPGFKPITAIVIITAIAYGGQAGFLTGALSAVVSNIFFGQGPWTPFQMFAWGVIGLIAGLIAKNREKPNMIIVSVEGIVGGALFSMIMDVWSVLTMDGGWNFSRYLATIVSSFSFTAIYMVSNIVFLILLTRPFLEKLNRMKKKYGLFENI